VYYGGDVSTVLGIIRVGGNHRVGIEIAGSATTAAPPNTAVLRKLRRLKLSFIAKLAASKQNKQGSHP